MDNKVVGSPCKFCGEPYIQGKNGAYCKACYIKWKNSQKGSQTGETTPQPSQPAVSSKVWEMKDRLSQAQTALNVAGNVQKNAGDDEAVIESANKYYKWLRQAKAGFISEGQDENIAPTEEDFNSF